jgi:hypothetical protein
LAHLQAAASSALQSQHDSQRAANTSKGCVCCPKDTGDLLTTSCVTS